MLTTEREAVGDRETAGFKSVEFKFDRKFNNTHRSTMAATPSLVLDLSCLI